MKTLQPRKSTKTLDIIVATFGPKNAGSFSELLLGNTRIKREDKLNTIIIIIARTFYDFTIWSM